MDKRTGSPLRSRCREALGGSEVTPNDAKSIIERGKLRNWDLVQLELVVDQLHNREVGSAQRYLSADVGAVLKPYSPIDGASTGGCNPT
jgi:hypothetical protein